MITNYLFGNLNRTAVYSEEVNIQGQVKFIEMNGALIEYVKTDFGKIEQVLSTTPYSELYSVNGVKL